VTTALPLPSVIAVVAERLAPDPAALRIYDLMAAEYEELHARLVPVNAVLGSVEQAGRG